MDMEKTARKMAELNARVQDWQDLVNATFHETWRMEDGFDEALRAASDRARSAAGISPLPDLYLLLDEVSESYLQADEPTRSAVRDLVGENRAVLHKMYEYIGHTATQVRKTRAQEWLRRGLAAALMEDARTDFRDLYLALGDLYLEAARAGLDPGSAFRDVGHGASRDSGGRSTAEMVEKFEQSAFFSADVKPKIGQHRWAW